MLCRLCFYEFGDENAVTLFSDGGESNLTKLIAKYLYIEVAHDDSYSTNICRECFQNLNDFHKFVQHVQQRQNVFQNLSHDAKPLFKSPAESKSTLNFDETPLELKEFSHSEDSEQIEFAYADIEDENDLKESEDDDDDEPLGNLIFREKRQRITRNNKACKSVGIKKTKTKRQKKSKFPKVTSIKKRKNAIEDANDNDTNDTDKSTKLNRNIYTAEEDRLRDELIAKHIQLKCEICDIFVNSYKDLKLHFRTEHNRKSYITCCGKRFTQRFLLVDHINSHLNPDHFKCTICGKVFKSRICVGVHMANKHSDRDQMRHCCNLCGKRFSHQSILTTHMLVHTQERNHVCEICKKGFKSVHVLKAHTQHMHGEKAPYVCETCGKEYRFKLSFERHIAEHQGQSDQREQCSICRQWFSSNYLQRHIKRHELADVDCEKCGKTFKSKAALSSHMEYSHRSKRTYACTFCDKTFERALNLKEHIDMHTGNKDYNCPHCPREFRSKANMYAHVKKMHYEQWAQAQCLRNQGPNGTTDINNETKNIEAS